MSIGLAESATRDDRGGGDGPGGDAALATARAEAWKYTPLKEIVDRISAIANVATNVVVDAPAGASTGVPDVGSGDGLTVDDVEQLAGPRVGPRLVFVNGAHRADLSEVADVADLSGGPAGGIFVGVAGSSQGPEAADVPIAPDVPDDARRAIAELPVSFGPAGSFGPSGDVAAVVVAAGMRSAEPIHIVHVVAAERADVGVMSCARTYVEVGDGGEATVIETFCGLGGATVTDASTTISIGENAQLDHHRLQVEPAGAVHVGHTRIDQQTGSQLRLFAVTTGADIGRNAIDVLLDAPGARAELAGVTLTGEGQRHDTVVTVDHAAPRCASSQRFRGVVGGTGRGSFGGEIIVRPGADGTDAHQSSRNLVLDPRAEADARPWLRIHADDVRCTHGATVGRLDEDALFYLRSRGIDAVTARSMLIDAFVADLAGEIRSDVVREQVEAILAVHVGGQARAEVDGDGQTSDVPTSDVPTSDDEAEVSP